MSSFRRFESIGYKENHKPHVIPKINKGYKSSSSYTEETILAFYRKDPVISQLHKFPDLKPRLVLKKKEIKTRRDID